MKKVFFSLLIALSVLMVPALASADDVMPPAWRGAPGTTLSVWDFSDGSLLFDFFTQNPSMPQLDSPFIYAEDWVLGPGGISFPTPFIISLDNFDTQNPVKEIRLQITYQPMDNMPWILSVYGDPELQWEPSFVGYVDQGEGWYTDVWDLTLWPNPWWEEIVVGAYDLSPLLISQLVVDTWCVGGSEVPVPAAIWLLGSGLIGLLGLRRKFRG